MKKPKRLDVDKPQIKAPVDSQTMRMTYDNDKGEFTVETIATQPLDDLLNNPEPYSVLFKTLEPYALKQGKQK